MCAQKQIKLYHSDSEGYNHASYILRYAFLNNHKTVPYGDMDKIMKADVTLQENCETDERHRLYKTYGADGCKKEPENR